MSDSNDDTDDEEMDLAEFYNALTGGSAGFGGTFMSPMAGMMVDSVDPEPSQAVEIATRMMMAGNTINEFVDYLQERDLDLDELDEETMENLDYEERVVIFGFMSMSSGLQRLGGEFEDDDGDNPFKVSDGDDPVY